MKPPTKFQKMRDNRASFECQANRTDVWSRLFSGSTMQLNQGVAPASGPDKTPAEPPKRRTMTVDGEEYVEVPEQDEDGSCAGCAFHGSPIGTCFDERGICEVAEQTFGGNCISRDVIYLKAT